MAMNLLDAVRNYLPPNLADTASKYLNESPTGISKAITAAVPALLAGFVNRAESGDAHGLLNDAHAAADSGVLNNPQGLFDNPGGLLTGGLDRLKGLFGGGGIGNISSALSSFAGIKSDSIQSLLAMLAPLGLGVLGRHARENNMSEQGLTAYLADQKSSIMSALPAGLSLGSLFGGPKVHSTGVGSNVRESKAYVEDRAPKSGSSWLLWLILAIAAIALLWYFLGKGCNKSETEATTTDTTTTMTTAPVDTSMNTNTTTTTERQSMKVKLADGTEINAYSGGIEDQLVKCLDDAACQAGKDKWFDFDNINFETGSAKLTSESQQQVQNIVAILKAYPKAKIKIGGYTDKVGNADANKKLSQQRADAVMNAIKSAGANAGQLAGAEGYGSQFAKVDASASDEERRSDRRIAVQLREK
jgi:outer membrane protein OmpA-like peptidoglycan-associated protein